MPLGLEYICEDLSKLSCKEGKFNDGTGTSRSVSSVTTLLNKLKPQTFEHFSQAISQFFNHNTPESRELYSIALKAVAGNAPTQCKTPNSNECRNWVTQTLSKLYTNSSLLNTGSDYTQHKKEVEVDFSFSALDRLINDPALKKALKPARQKTEEAILKLGSTQKIKPLFEQAKTALKKRIGSWVQNPESLQKKIDQVTLNVSDCNDFIKNEDLAPTKALTYPNAFFSPPHTVNVCNGFLLYGDSEFALTQTLLHELAHSIDPCQLAKDKSGNPFSAILTCLRSPRSAQASGEDTLDPGFCTKKDQINEAFAEWASNEVLPDVIEQRHPHLSPLQKIIGYANVNRFACSLERNYASMYESQGLSYPQDEHLRTHTSINRILMANPQIRKSVGCGSDQNTPVHCPEGLK